MAPGEKHNFLTAIKMTSGGKWLFSCVCGVEKEIFAGNVKSGSTKSCGCKNHPTTNFAKHELYYTWSGIKARCGNKKHAAYHNYGGRGIKVCERWLKFENFIADMGERPSKGHSVERINSDGNYEPSNCYWATRAEQSRNTRRNHYIAHDGLNLTVRDWEIKMNVGKGTFQRRVDLGWPDIDVITRPVQPGKPLEKRV